MAEESIPPLSPEERKARKSAAQKKWRAAHAEQVRATNQAWKAAHPEQCKAHARKSRQKHRAKATVRSRDWYQRNLDRARESGRCKAAKQYAANPARRQANSLRWKQKHAAEVLQYAKDYAAAHPEVGRATSRRRRARKKAAPICDFTAAQWRALCKAVDYRCAYCGQKFLLRELTQDHITPLSKGGNHTLGNIIPACASCNSRKKTGEAPKPVQPFLLLDDSAAD
jgi:5-methylcytosine-specific restriction endonuclease McrA